MFTCFIVCPITITRTRGGFVALSPISPQELFLQSMSSDTDAAQQQNLVSKEQLFVHIMTVIYTSAEPPKLNNLELMPIFLGKICQTWCHHLANLVWLQSREHRRQCHCIIFFKSSHWPAQPWGAHKCWRSPIVLLSCQHSCTPPGDALSGYNWSWLWPLPQWRKPPSHRFDGTCLSVKLPIKPLQYKDMPLTKPSLLRSGKQSP